MKKKTLRFVCLFGFGKKNLGLKDFEPNFSQVNATITKSPEKFEMKKIITENY